MEVAGERCQVQPSASRGETAVGLKEGHTPNGMGEGQKEERTQSEMEGGQKEERIENAMEEALEVECIEEEDLQVERRSEMVVVL